MRGDSAQMQPGSFMPFQSQSWIDSQDTKRLVDLNGFRNGKEEYRKYSHRQSAVSLFMIDFFNFALFFLTFAYRRNIAVMDIRTLFQWIGLSFTIFRWFLII